MLKRLDVARPRSVIGWAVVCGIAAGLLAATYGKIVGEPLVDQAIAIEESMPDDGADHTTTDMVYVSRGDQSGPGLFAGYALAGAASGLLLAATALSLRGPWLDPFRRIVVSGAILAGATTVVPWLKYPPNPPAVGDPDTVDTRQRLFFLLIALTGVILAGAAHLSARLRSAGWPDVRRVVVVGAAAVVALAVLMAVMPPIDDPIPSVMPAKLIWHFRVASLGSNLLRWGLLTVGFGLWCAESARAAAAARVASGAATGDQNSMPFIADIPSS